jgi:hypothetical protein
MKNLPIDRRTLLKGLGVGIALPALEAMMPSVLRASTPTPAALPPRRLAFVYVPNGVNMQTWTPTALGPNFQLPATLEPLAPVRDHLTILSGLTCDKARPNGDGPGDHARAMASFLTGRQARKTAGADIRVGVSADQVVAQQRGTETRFPSLEIGCEGGRQAGGCDSGYSCAYSNNLSWRSESTPVPKETNPRAVFDRLFAGPVAGEAEQARLRRERYNQSILDFVSEDANQLMNRLGTADQRRMDEYLTSLREVERRVTQTTSGPNSVRPGTPRPTGTPQDYGQHLRLMGDLLTLAFQADLTRVATFVFANEGSNRNYRLINIPDGHHDLSHHQNNAEKLDKIHRINRFHIEQFAHMLTRMQAVREADGSTLLDNAMIVYGSGNGDGNRHNHDNLPVLLAGKGGGTVTAGRHIRYPFNLPICNLYISLLERMGCTVPSFGDSTGRLPGLT